MLFPRFRMVIAVVIIAFGALLSAAATEPSVQQEECDYDRANPSIDHARAFFSRLEYQCALTELQDILSADNLESHLRAEAYRLLSAVHYWIGYDEDEPTEVIKEKVINTGKAAFKALPEWTGEFDIDDEDYLAWMREAKQAAQEELERERLLQQQVEEARRDSIALAEKRTADSLASITLSEREQDAVPEPTAWRTSMDDYQSDYLSARRRNRYKKLVTGLAVLGGATTTFLMHKKAEDSYDKYMVSRNPEDISNNLYWSKYEQEVELRNVLGGVTVGLAVLEVIWFVTAPERPNSDLGDSHSSSDRTTVGFGFDGRTLFVRCSF